MKKVTTFLMTLIAAGISNLTHAQDEIVTIGNRVYETQKFRFGAYVAPTASYMKPTASKDKNGAHHTEKGQGGTGFTYGLMGEYWFAPNYAIVSGLQMNMAKGGIITKSVDQNLANTVRNSDINYKLNYVQVPLALKLRTQPIEKFSFFGQVGFGLGINVGKKFDYAITYNDDLGNPVNLPAGNDEKIVSKGLKPGISPVMFDFNVGVGAEYPINQNLAAYFGVFFNNGFLPDATYPSNYKFANNSNVPEFSDGNVRVNNFAFRIGLFF